MKNKNTVYYQYLSNGFTKFSKYSSCLVTIKVLCNKLTKEPYGFVYVIIKQSTLNKYYDYFVGNGNSIAIIAPDGTIVSSNIPLMIGVKNKPLYDISENILNNNLNYLNTKLVSSDVTILAKHLPTYNFNIVGTIDKDIVLSEMYNTSEIMTTSILIAFIFIIT